MLNTLLPRQTFTINAACIDFKQHLLSKVPSVKMLQTSSMAVVLALAPWVLHKILIAMKHNMLWCYEQCQGLLSLATIASIFATQDPIAVAKAIKL